MFDYTTHEKYMKTILKNIFSDEIGKFLAFKGGTLAYLNHKLDRFSTDIDLDILDLEQEEKIINNIRQILPIHGEIKNETLGKMLHRWMFRYDEKSMNIKVEFNKRVWENNTYESQTIAEIAIPCMTPDCMFSNKLVALSERSLARDLYDVYFFFREKFPIKESLIQERTALSTKKFLQNLVKELPKHFTENSVLTGLGEVLDDKQKLWVKKHLLKETIAQIKKFLANI